MGVGVRHFLALGKRISNMIRVLGDNFSSILMTVLTLEKNLLELCRQRK